LQGKIEVYNKIVKNEFISVEQISSIDEGKVRYDMFVTNDIIKKPVALDHIV
jgi:hypothetical protein